MLLPRVAPVNVEKSHNKLFQEKLLSIYLQSVADFSVFQLEGIFLTNVFIPFFVNMGVLILKGNV